ncbi:MAG: heme-binding beta-barrel domain-containing protein [Immundisolibacteraceae bacterium]|nr:heme-binding beta-barrel domain-containing protein [Immundisolibacteraceae bacterium]
MSDEMDLGPLEELIGVWSGDKGVDRVPEPQGANENPYNETITYVLVGNHKNADSQRLAVVRYHQEVIHQVSGAKIHDESGYWMWEAATGTVMNSIIIPRGVCVLAGGQFNGEFDESGKLVLAVESSLDHPHWNIVQSPFMQREARTTAFNRKLMVGNGQMKYAQSTKLEIYDKPFNHTDENELTRQ